MHKTSPWFNDAALSGIALRYQSLATQPLSYGTVRDYCDSFDHLRPLATANADLKDCQRPWVLKAILSQVPRGGRVLEIGAGEPFVGAGEDDRAAAGSPLRVEQKRGRHLV